MGDSTGSKHMKRDWITFVGLIICCTPTYGQLLLKDFRFDSWFGYELKSNTENTYCLLGTGFFTSPKAKNTDSLITSWSQLHPDAKVLPIYTGGPTFTNLPNSKLIYCWVFDNLDTLNIDLVRQGCVPGGTMLRPTTRNEISKKDRKNVRADKKLDEQVHIDNKSYKDFLDKIVKAENEAKRNRIGIWTQKEE